MILIFLDREAEQVALLGGGRLAGHARRHHDETRPAAGRREYAGQFFGGDQAGPARGGLEQQFARGTVAGDVDEAYLAITPSNSAGTLGVHEVFVLAGAADPHMPL
jgi:hypothetical protein